jgi:hypothetical protein
MPFIGFEVRDWDGVELVYLRRRVGARVRLAATRHIALATVKQFVPTALVEENPAYVTTRCAAWRSGPALEKIAILAITRHELLFKAAYVDLFEDLRDYVAQFAASNDDDEEDAAMFREVGAAFTNVAAGLDASLEFAFAAVNLVPYTVMHPHSVGVYALADQLVSLALEHFSTNYKPRFDRCAELGVDMMNRFVRLAEDEFKLEKLDALEASLRGRYWTLCYL